MGTLRLFLQFYLLLELVKGAARAYLFFTVFLRTRDLVIEVCARPKQCKFLEFAPYQFKSGVEFKTYRVYCHGNCLRLRRAENSGCTVFEARPMFITSLVCDLRIQSIYKQLYTERFRFDFKPKQFTFY
jgi:hypothetical protein